MSDAKHPRANGRTEPFDEPTVSGSQLLRSVLRGRTFIARVTLALVLLIGLTELLGSRHYSVSSSFVPDSRRPSGNLSGLAAQLGVPVPGGDATESPQFYADLVSSPELLRRVAIGGYASPNGDTMYRAPLPLVLGYGPATDESALQKAVQWLQGAVNAVLRAKTGVILLNVTAPTSRLAYEINANVLEQVNQFNLETRKTRAAKEREFTESRIGELRTSLREAEDALARFLSRNRDTREVPDLAFQRDRLAREVQLRQSLYASMAQSYEQAHLEEVRDTPVITIIDRPHPPLVPDGRGIVIRTFVALVAGLALGALAVVARDGLKGALPGSEVAPGELRRDIRLTMRDLQRPWRLVAGKRYGIPRPPDR